MTALPSCRDCSAPATLLVAGIPLCEVCYTAAGSCCHERDEDESSPTTPTSPRASSTSSTTTLIQLSSNRPGTENRVPTV